MRPGNPFLVGLPHLAGLQEGTRVQGWSLRPPGRPGSAPHPLSAYGHRASSLPLPCPEWVQEGCLCHPGGTEAAEPHHMEIKSGQGAPGGS